MKNARRILSLLLCAACLVSAAAGAVFAQENGKISGFDNDKVRINRGSNQGIVDGITLNVYRETPIYHPSTRERIGSTESVIGTIRASEIYPDFSLCIVVTSEKQFVVGDVVRISFVVSTEAQEPEQYEKGSVVSVSDNLVKFNMGEWDGVEENLLFDVFRPVGPSRHPVTGEVIEPKNLFLGMVKAVSVSDRETISQIISREREMQPGDRVVLSMQQSGDIEMPSETKVARVPESSEMERQQTVPMDTPISGSDTIVGRVTKVTGKDVYFLWRSDYGFPAGKVFGIFRREEIRHPETGHVIDNPLLLLGQVRLVESIGELGRGTLLSSDADILPQDQIGLAVGETLESGQIVSPLNSDVVYDSRRSDILKQAEELTADVKHIQGEMSVIKSAIARLDRIDRELSEQKAMTASMSRSIEEIKMLLRGEGYTVESQELIPSRASVDKMEFPGRQENVLRLKYTDDISVDISLDNKTLFVALKTDTTLAHQLKTSPQEFQLPEDTTAQTPVRGEDTKIAEGASIETGEAAEGEGEQGTPFYKNWMLLGGIFVVLLIIAGALYFLLVLKKKQGGGAARSASDDDGEDDADDIESMDEDDFGEDEIGADEEEIEAFEDEEV